VQDFVRAAHSDLPKVQAMLAEEGALLYASWDWGNGDWENAIEAASHRANRAIANFLLEKGARQSPFCLAMLGHKDAVAALIQVNPYLCQALAPHGLTLLYHAALTNRVDLVELIATNIRGEKAPHFNQALQGAARNGSREVVAWLIANGVSNPNETSFFNGNPLDIAIGRGDDEIVEIIRAHGGVTAG
jgi:ankyrin repeat protein